jgi:hypothetical protein
MENEKVAEAYTAEKEIIQAACNAVWRYADDLSDTRLDRVDWTDVEFLWDIGRAIEGVADQVLRRGEFGPTPPGTPFMSMNGKLIIAVPGRGRHRFMVEGYDLVFDEVREATDYAVRMTGRASDDARRANDAT